MKYQLQAAPITAKSKGEVKRLRSSGYVPVSVQHRGEPTLHLMEESKQIQEFILHHGQSTMVELHVAPGKTKMNVMVHSIQRDPLTQKVIHVTYQKIDRTDEIHTNVPLSFTGEPEAIKRGIAVAQHPIEQIAIKCKQAHLPERFTIDISHLQVGDVIRVADLPHDSHVTIVTPGDTAIVSLKPLTAAQVEPEAEAPAAAAETAE